MNEKRDNIYMHGKKARHDMNYIIIALKLRRLYIMAKNTTNVIKGVGAGLAAGILFGLARSVMMKDDKKNKKKASRAIDAVEDILDSMHGIFTN